jgi:hypothetical protein
MVQSTALGQRLLGQNNLKDKSGESFWQQVGAASGWDTAPFVKKIFGNEPDMLDVYGQTIPKSAIYGLSWTNDKNDMVTSELLRIKSSISTSDTVYGAKLDPQQKIFFNHEYGVALHDELTLQMATPTYQNADIEAQKAFVSRVHEAARAVALTRLEDTYPAFQQAAESKKAASVDLKQSEVGMPTKGSIMNDIKADPNADPNAFAP